MFGFILDGGMFMILIFIGAALLLVLSIKKVMEYYTNSGVVKSDSSIGLNFILFGGILLACLGILGTVMGLYMAFGHIANVAEISPQIILMGTRMALSTTLAGLFFMVIFSSVWFILNSKYQKLVSN